MTGQSKRTRVVVTGLGTTNPLGGNVADTWDGMVAGRSGVRPLADSPVFAAFIESGLAADLPVGIGGTAAVEPTDVLERVRARRLDRSSQFALIAALEAWKDSGLDVPQQAGELDGDRIGVAMASGIGGVHTLLSNYDVLLAKGPRRVSPISVPMLMANAPAATISLEIGARAAVNTPVSACASGNEAIALAADQIRLGRADVVLAGGTEAAIHPLPIAAFANMMALSKNPNDPATVSRPWDTARDGFVLGEGAGALVLESEEHALARGARIYAEVLGTGITADSHDIAQPDPAGKGGARAIVRALQDGDIDPANVAHVNAHATSTPRATSRRPDAARDARLARQRGRRDQHQVHDRAPARRRRCTRGGGDDPGAPPPALAPDDQPRRPRPGGRARHRHQARDLPHGDIVGLNNSFGFGGANVAVAFRVSRSLCPSPPPSSSAPGPPLSLFPPPSARRRHPGRGLLLRRAASEVRHGRLRPS